MRTFKKKINSLDDIYHLTYFIRSNFAEDSLRLRASFIWITENIAYDVNAFIKDDPAAGQIDYALKKKKAVCAGYANLLKYLCDAFNIECEIITGVARAGKKDIFLNQQSLRVNHAWNMVKVNGTWRLIDATWAAGTIDEPEDVKDTKYKKQLNDFYYFTPPEKMIFNHFPKLTKHQLQRPLVSESSFKKQPLLTTEFLKQGIERPFPDSAVLKLKKGDTVLFRFKTNKSAMQQLCAYSDRIEKAAFCSFPEQNGEWIEFYYPVKVSGYYNLYIGFNDGFTTKALMAYRLEVN